MNNLKYLLLDWDGCMANTLQVWMQTYLSLYKEAGIKVTSKDIVAHSWGNLAQGPRYFGIENYDAFWIKIVNQVKIGVAKVDLYPGVKLTLESIKKLGIPMTIVTSSERKLLVPALKYHGLDQIVDYVVTEEEVRKPKPDPEMLYLALKKMGGEVNSALIIGDSAKDITAGKNGEIKTALMLHPENTRFYNFEKLRELKSDYELNAFSELLTIFK
jgi:pyrophosphatase PpaX